MSPDGRADEMSSPPRSMHRRAIGHRVGQPLTPLSTRSVARSGPITPAGAPWGVHLRLGRVRATRLSQPVAGACDAKQPKDPHPGAVDGSGESAAWSADDPPVPGPATDAGLALRLWKPLLARRKLSQEETGVCCETIHGDRNSDPGAGSGVRWRQRRGRAQQPQAPPGPQSSDQTREASLADQVATTTVQDEQLLSAVWSVGLNEYGNTEVDYLWAIGDM